MKKLEKSIKKRYLLFISTIILIIIAIVFIIKNSVNSQLSDTHLINISGKQRALSQSVAKLIINIGYNENVATKVTSVNSLKNLTREWDSIHNYLKILNKENQNNSKIDSLLKINELYKKKVIEVSKNIIENPNSELLNKDVEIISEAESLYLLNAHLLVKEYQKMAEEHLIKLKHTIYLLALIAFLILVGEFLFILVPALNQLFNKNNELAKSESTIKEQVLELTRLKTDLEAKEAYNRIFIEQAPTAIAMLDKNMVYMAVSQRWITDYKMEGQEIIGCSHYDLFPEIGDDWKENHQKCLNGAIDRCDEAPFTRADGSVQWIFWDVRPWYISEGHIGGLIMHTGDITHVKENEGDRIRIEKILDRTNEIARIGTWDIDLVKNTIFWSKVVFEIHEVPKDFLPDLETAINFFKEGESRDTIKNAVKAASENGSSYDVEVELVTSKGNIIWTRAIGQAEIVNGKCVRIFGVFQDVNDMKLSQIALNKAHTELKALFNSGSIAIVTTDSDGFINRFNHGAEILTGYSASEMIGLQKPDIYHFEQELNKFTKDIAKLYGKNPIGFNPQLELSKNNDYDTREWTYQRKDGSILPVQLTLSGIKDEQDKSIGFLGVSSDISDIRAAQNELLRKNQLLNFAEEITLMGNWQWDTVADKVEWSNNLYNIFQLDKEIDNLDFGTYFSFVHPDDKEIVKEYFNKTVEDKNLNRLTHRIIAGDGQLKTIQLLGEVITNEKDEVVEMIGSCQDITAIKVAETELLRKNQLLNFAEEITMMGHWQWDTAADNVLWSDNLYKMFEIDEVTYDLKFDSYFKYVHPDDKHIVTAYFDKAAKEKRFYSFVHRIITAKGKIKMVQLLGEVFTNDKGEVIEMIGTGQDITEQKLAENKFRGLLESAPDAMVIVNEKGKIQLINKQAEKLFGYHIDELLDKSVEMLIPKRFTGMHVAHRDDFFSNPKTRSMGEGKELYGKNKKGDEIPIQISLSPLKTEEGLLVSAAIRDITEQKLAARKIIEAKESLEVLANKLTTQNTQLADFAHITSHNLRAPVSNLNSLLDFYNTSESEEDKATLFKKFEKVIHHLTLTLNTLVEAIKTKNETSENLEDIMFDEVLNKTKEILSGEILKTGTIITSDFSKINKISYNKVYLESIFLNLVGNAIKYRSDARVPELFIESEIVEGQTRLKFKDNGMGIDLEKHGNKLFGLNKVFHRHPEAKGVGLFMTKTQVEAMGGVISATSQVSEGTTFSINF